MTFSSDDRATLRELTLDGGPDAQHQPHWSRARLGRLVAAVALGVAAILGGRFESTLSILTDHETVTVGVTAAPSFPTAPARIRTTTRSTAPSTPPALRSSTRGSSRR